jgi:Bacterial SH3 domain
MSRIYKKTYLFGDEYLEDDEGNRVYKKEDLFGDEYWVDDNGNRVYNKEDLFGDEYLENDNGDRTYKREDLFGDEYLENDNGDRAYIKKDLWGDTYIESGTGNHPKGFIESEKNSKERSSNSSSSSNRASNSVSGISDYNASRYTSTSEVDGSGAAVGLLVIIGIVVAFWFGSQTDTDKQPANSNPLPTALPYNSSQHEPETLYVNTKQMKLRGGPGVQYGDLGRISFGDAVVATETAASTDGGNWVKVKTGNLEGWLNRKFLSATQPVLDGFNTLSVIIGNECYCGSHGSSFDATYNGKSITVFVSYNVTEANPVSHPLVISQKGYVTNDFSLLPCQSGENKCPDAGSMVLVTGNWTGNSDFEARQLDFPK